MIERLRIVLENLRVTEEQKPNIRINILFAIMAHAVSCGDTEMQAAADEEIKVIQAAKRQQAEEEAAAVAAKDAPKAAPISETTPNPPTKS